MALDQAFDGGANTTLEGSRALAARDDVPGRVLDPATPFLWVAGDYLVALEAFPFAQRNLPQLRQVVGCATDLRRDLVRRLARAHQVAAVEGVDLRVAQAHAGFSFLLPTLLRERRVQLSLDASLV